MHSENYGEITKPKGFVFSPKLFRNFPGMMTIKIIMIIMTTSVVERERGRPEGRSSRPWRNIFPGSRSRSGTQREVKTVINVQLVTIFIITIIIIAINTIITINIVIIKVNIDEAVLMPESRPINFRPRPRSEVNLSYSVQVVMMMLMMTMMMLTMMLMMMLTALMQ